MNSEANRLQTFRDWPANAAISPERIARAGFFYTRQEQVVQCFLCGTTVSEWNYGAQAMSLHRQANPECPFVQDPTSTCNVPIINVANGNIPLNSENTSASHDNAQIFTLDRSNLELVQSFKKYSTRLNTFTNWPSPEIVSPESLAKVGFYYLQKYDMVACIYCGGIVMKWEPGDDPDREHRVHFPQCNFYVQVAMEDDQSAEKLILGNVKLLPGTTSNLAELGILNHTAPRQPKHATFENRLRTFQGWPSNLKQTPEMLADAGFYYVGSEDQVRCFHCDGGLRNWEDTDDTWIEHAKWFPKCGYVAIVKGQNFIKQCVESRPRLDSTIRMSTENDESTENSTPPVSPASTPLTQNVPRQVTDAELESLLSTPPVMAALEIGITVGRIKIALKRRIEQTGMPYSTAEQLIEHATQVQLSEEDNLLNRRTPDSPSAELAQLLNRIITSSTEAASNSMSQSGNMIQNECKQNIIEPNKIPPVVMEPDRKVKTHEEMKKLAQSLSLEEEIRRLREARQCRICMDREVEVVFLPCGHLSTCTFCAPSLTYCPMCRREIRATVRTFLA